MAEQYKYTLRDFDSNEVLGPASEELAKGYESALQAGARFITINPHGFKRKVYVEHGYRTPSPESQAELAKQGPESGT